MTNYLDFLDRIVQEDVKVLLEKEKSYKDSWKRRGGPGAFFVAIRKADRLENILPQYGYDIFKAAEQDTRDEGILDDIQDLRRYLILIEAEILARRELAISSQLGKTADAMVATPAGIRKVPRHDPSPTEMEAPFGYNPELDDGE